MRRVLVALTLIAGCAGGETRPANCALGFTRCVGGSIEECIEDPGSTATTKPHLMMVVDECDARGLTCQDCSSLGTGYYGGATCLAANDGLICYPPGWDRARQCGSVDVPCCVPGTTRCNGSVVEQCRDPLGGTEKGRWYSTGVACSR